MTLSDKGQGRQLKCTVLVQQTWGCPTLDSRLLTAELFQRHSDRCPLLFVMHQNKVITAEDRKSHQRMTEGIMFSATNVGLMFFVVCCCLFCFPHARSQRDCGPQMPSGCKLHRNGLSDDCDRRSAQLLAANSGAWPQSVRNLSVQPFSSVTGQDSHAAVSLALTWTPPHRSAELLKGLKLTVTALDDASQHTLCHLFDFSAVRWGLSGSQCVMSYNVTLPRMPGVYNWHVQLESLPSPGNVNWSHSTTSLFVSIDNVDSTATTKPVCSVTVIVGSTSINVTLGSDVSRDRMTSGEVFVYDYARGACCCDLQYDVVLYECDEALWCCDHCDLTELALHPLTSLRQMVSFTEVPPGLYRVWVYPVGIFDHVCSATPALNITGIDSSKPSPQTASPTPTASATTVSIHHVLSTRNEHNNGNKNGQNHPNSTQKPAGTEYSTESSGTWQSTDFVTEHSRESGTGQRTDFVTEHSRESGTGQRTGFVTEHSRESGTGQRTESVTVHSTDSGTAPTDAVQIPWDVARLGTRPSHLDDSWKLVVASSVSVCICVVVVLVAAVVCYCWRRRVRTLRFVDDLPCMDKLMTSGSCQSSTSDHDPLARLCSTPTCPPLPTLSVCLLSYPGLTQHNHAVDSLALYLQAFCACDVTYFRWQWDDIRFVGPELWTAEQLDRADCVIFVHSHETRDCYEAWETDQLKDTKANVATRMLVAAFDRVCTARRTPCRWFNVTFYSDLSVLSDYCLLGAQFGSSSEGTQADSDCSAGPDTHSSAVYTEDGPACAGLTGSRGTPRPPETNSVCAHDSLARAANGNSGSTTKPPDTSSTRAQDSFARSTMTGRRGSPRSPEGDSAAGTHVMYRLMNDFSQLLSDLHRLPNNPSVLREHRLPSDSDHLDTQEGRQLYKSVVSLRQARDMFRDADSACTLLPSRERMCLETLTTQGDGDGCRTMAQRMDSGFDEYSISFIGPDELSAVDTEDTSSLGDRFRDINARYERNQADSSSDGWGDGLFRDGDNTSLCYSLGGRFV